MKWYEIKNKGDKAEIWIYEQIGEDFWTGGGVTAKSFQEELSAIKASHIDLHINSPGGVVFEGLAIYNLLKQHPATVDTYIEGVAASIASVIALSGDKVYMAENALFMVHNPQGIVRGGSADMRKMADLIDIIRDSIAKAYVSKTGKPATEILALMDSETWMTAYEAIEFGFVDDVTGKMDLAACARFVPIMAKAGFKNIPESITSQKAATRKNAEKALRNAGFSRPEARNILAKGISDGLRNAVIADDPEWTVEPLRNAGDDKKPKKDRVADLLTRAEMMAPAAIQPTIGGN